MLSTPVNGRLQLQEGGNTLLLDCEHVLGEARIRGDNRSSHGHGLITRSRREEIFRVPPSEMEVMLLTHVLRYAPQSA